MAKMLVKDRAPLSYAIFMAKGALKTLNAQDILDIGGEAAVADYIAGYVPYVSKVVELAQEKDVEFPADFMEDVCAMFGEHLAKNTMLTEQEHTDQISHEIAKVFFPVDNDDYGVLEFGDDLRTAFGTVKV